MSRLSARRVYEFAKYVNGSFSDSKFVDSYHIHHGFEFADGENYKDVVSLKGTKKHKQKFRIYESDTILKKKTKEASTPLQTDAGFDTFFNDFRFNYVQRIQKSGQVYSGAIPLLPPSGSVKIYSEGSSKLGVCGIAAIMVDEHGNMVAYAVKRVVDHQDTNRLEALAVLLGFDLIQDPVVAARLAAGNLDILLETDSMGVFRSINLGEKAKKSYEDLSPEMRSRKSQLDVVVGFIPGIANLAAHELAYNVASGARTIGETQFQYKVPTELVGILDIMRKETAQYKRG